MCKIHHNMHPLVITEMYAQNHNIYDYKKISIKVCIISVPSADNAMYVLNKRICVNTTDRCVCESDCI